MPDPLQNKNILIGVTGSIAAYKAADLASKLTQAGAAVDVILTPAARRFITQLTFQSVTGRKAFTEDDLWGGEGHVRHIGLGMSGDVLLVAPASADTIAKLAHGIADNLLCITALAARCPLVVAPAMDGGMFTHPATQANLETLRLRGAAILGPGEGRMASGLVGKGRMLEPDEILAAVRWQFSRGGAFAGVRVLVTAGGTQEPIDPVRVITNRSSGRQGYALAQAALNGGADVVLIHTPTGLPIPFGAEEVGVCTAAEMQQAVLEQAAQADVVIMAAAVADFRPVSVALNKIKKAGGIPEIHLEPTEDILAALARQLADSLRPRVVVGFAAESQDLIANAAAKLAAKRLDLIVANDISAQDAGFVVPNNRVVLLFPDGRTQALPLMRKSEVAEAILNEVKGLLGKIQ
ncbi:MAG TPA: bifunctional phosphopantothenoylcysteine decarboxylase/phosphopantothenate--cysteine ligase CoaBC [Anaerolineaceae bacterium]|jgi:phosphopantothenoylcysteine decarboxylase/phosphopantothenate--cysteine ligase